jgi:type IV conjugative transfer system protein TraL
MENDFFLPRYLDEPERLIIWTPKEFALIAVLAIVGLQMKQAIGMLIGFLLAMGILKILNGFKLKYGKNFLQFWCYWNFPPISKNSKIFPPSHIRKWFL